MKKLLFICLFGISSFSSFSQSAANRIVNAQAIPKDTTVNNFLFLTTVDNKIWVAKQDSMKLKYFQLKAWLTDTLNARAALKVNLSGSYSNPSWINSMAYSKLTGTPTIPAAQVNSDWSSGSGSSQILNKPTIPTNTNQLTNGAGFLTSYSETDPQFDTKFAGKSTSNLSEGTRLYYTDARARASVSAGAGISYDNSTGIISTSVASPTYNNAPARPVNGTAYQISATKATRVSYAVTHTIALTLLLSSGSSSVFLEISPNGSTGWITINQAGFSDAVAIAVAITKTVTNNVQGEVPIGYFARLRATTSGAGSVVFTSGQEVN